MLLRRVMEHVRTQNWTAVFLDFIIVVVGVFIGIQVANWNGERQNREEERILIERLIVDFERIKQDATLSLAYHEKMHANLQIVVRSVRSEQLAPNNVRAFEEALLLGIGFQTSADQSGTFTELMSSGRANILQDRNLLDELVDYEDFINTRFVISQQYFKDMVMHALPNYAAAFSYNDELNITSALFEGKAEASGLVTYDFEKLSKDTAFENSAEQLMFVHSGFILWRKRIGERVDKILERLTTIKDKT
ncbi:hypothetical protein PN836_014730 [Ningiella sp. W23]|uniref:hypothetical protein n=1 Tax=Ningiella sp. W23 TaxID=3023715 RepID=UPI003757C193